MSDIPQPQSISRNVCPISGAPGHPLRTRESQSLVDSYERYFGKRLPETIVEKYFGQTITEYYTAESGLRWYEPCRLGDSDFYQTLDDLFDWYYQADTWDKRMAMTLLRSLGCASVLEVGCGDGHFLQRLHELGIQAIGVDLNEEAVRFARAAGRRIFTVSEASSMEGRVDCLCAFQTIEHVLNPVEFLSGYIDRFRPQRIILSAPSHETLLGYHDDPLCWPPHHATQWSEKAFMHLGSQIGFKVAQVHHDEVRYEELRWVLRREGWRRLPGMPYIPRGPAGIFLFYTHRMLGADWATRKHSILVMMERDRT